MAHSHYVMDLYYPLAEGSDRFRREVLRIDAADDEAATAEGQRIDAWRKPSYFTVRGIQTPARAADRLIYTSQVEEAPVPAASASGEAVISVAPE